MSLIHQKLYQSEDIKTVNMASYIPEFMSNLKDSYHVSPSVSFFAWQLNPLKMGVNQAVPMALILNEAVTNSIKYAFP